MNHVTQQNIFPVPMQLLQKYSKLHPNMWKVCDSLHQENCKNGHAWWPDWCFLPGVTFFEFFIGREEKRFTDDSSKKVKIYHALSSWRTTQGIYRFDRELSQSLLSTDLSSIPTDVLYRLPEWCVYIEFPFETEFKSGILDGFFAHFDCGEFGKPSYLVMTLVSSLGEFSSMSFDLTKKTLGESISAVIDLNNQNANDFGLSPITGDIDLFVNDISAIFAPLINLVLYLCSINADFGSDKHPQKPSPIKTKKGLRFFPPNRPCMWDVGFRIGSALRQEQAESTRASDQSFPDRHSPRPHIRRAHWHTYLTGAERSGRILKWLPPIPINLDQGDIVPTIRNVL